MACRHLRRPERFRRQLLDRSSPRTCRALWPSQPRAGGGPDSGSRGPDPDDHQPAPRPARPPARRPRPRLAKPAPEKPAARERDPDAAVVERNEFQDFIEQTLGQRLPIYGHNLFQDAPSTFAPVENIPVTPDYVIGPGDELLIRAWGQIDVDYRVVVDRNGTINIPRVGTVPVAGIRYENLTNHIRSADQPQLPELRSAGDDGHAALGADLRRRPGAPPRQLHRELALDPGERHLLRRRPLEPRLDAEHPAQARQQRRHRARPLRPDRLRRQVEGPPPPPRRRHLLPAHRPPRRPLRQRQQPGDLRAEGEHHRRPADRPRRRPHHDRPDPPRQRSSASTSAPRAPSTSSASTTTACAAR